MSYFTFHIEAISYGICLSVSDLLSFRMIISRHTGEVEGIEEQGQDQNPGLLR